MAQAPVSGSAVSGRSRRSRRTPASSSGPSGGRTRSAVRTARTWSRRLKPGRIVRIRTGKGTNDGNDLYWKRGWYVWNNDTDRATLKNPARKVVDRCAYKDGSTSENKTTKHC